MFLSKIHFAALCAATTLALPALAGDITIEDAYARAASPSAKSGAAFMIIRNTGDIDDRLVAASSGIAKRTELHTHIDAGDGVMLMREVEDGFEVPAQGAHMLMRGADHVMLMGLTQSLNHGDVIEVTLSFEQGGDMVVEIPVDLERSADHSMAPSQ